MRLKDFFQRWSKGEDARVTERAKEESQMTPEERAADGADFEGRKNDLLVGRGPAGEAARDATADDLHT